MVNMHHIKKCHYPHFYAQKNEGEEKSDALLWSVLVKNVSWE